MPRKAPHRPPRVETHVDRATVYLEAERSRHWPLEMCNDLRRRLQAKNWLGLSNDQLRERVKQECEQWK